MSSHNSKMSQRELVAAQIDHIETPEIPYTLELEEPVKEMLDEYFGSISWRKRIVESVVCIGAFDSWTTLVPIGNNKYIDAYGNELTMTDKISHFDIPILKKVPYDQYRFPTLNAFTNEEKNTEMKKALEKNKDCYPIVSVGAGVFELSCRIMGVESALESCALEPDYYSDVLRNLANLIHKFIDEAIKLPTEAIWIFDDWCDQRGVIMGIERWRKFIKPLQAEFYDKIHKAGKKTITHVCGSVEPLIPELMDIGLDVLESVQSEAVNMNPYVLKKKYGSKLTFWGGLGCQSIVTFGTPNEITA